VRLALEPPPPVLRLALLLELPPELLPELLLPELLLPELLLPEPPLTWDVLGEDPPPAPRKGTSSVLVVVP
jgi:hypothetical protein